jgi:hypothetical protein
MSRAYKFHKPDGLYFITFATVSRVDVFTRRDYKDIVVESLTFCQKEKGLLLLDHRRVCPPKPPASVRRSRGGHCVASRSSAKR